VGRSPVEVDELVEHWTVLEDEQQLVAGKRGATRLGFALLLKFYTRSGRFPRVSRRGGRDLVRVGWPMVALGRGPKGAR